MNKVPSVVEINGKKYNAVTGQILGKVKKTANRMKISTELFSMDGIVRRPAIAITKPASIRRYPKRAVHNVKREAHRTRTLMRKAVTKSRKNKKLADSQIKARTFGRNPARESRAKQTHQHPKIKRFGILSTISRNKSTGPTKEGEVISTGSSRSNAVALSSPLPAIISSPSHHRLERLLDYALARADAHKKLAKQKRRGPLKIAHRLPKWLNITLLLIISVSAVGFIAWQKLPAASLKLAGSAANVDAAMPTYIPEGFTAAGPAKAENGAVTLTYEAIDNEARNYILKEWASNQDSASAVANIASSSSQVQTSQNGGVDINIITDGDKSMAVCTNGGRQTTLENNANLAPSVISNILGSVC